jgi:hypothetical protein
MTDAEKQMRKYHWHAWERWAKSKTTTLMNNFIAARRIYLETHASAPEGQWEYLSGENVWLPTEVNKGITNELSQFIWEHYGPTRMKKENRHWFFPPANKGGDGGNGGAAGNAEEGDGGAEEGSGAAGGEGGTGNRRKRPGDPGYPDFFTVARQGGYGPKGEPPPSGAMKQICDILSALHTKLQSLELRQFDGV